jgi:hypothetical protein
VRCRAIDKRIAAATVFIVASEIDGGVGAAGSIVEKEPFAG